jgi:hypothetical protein
LHGGSWLVVEVAFPSDSIIPTTANLAYLRRPPARALMRVGTLLAEQIEATKCK